MFNSRQFEDYCQRLGLPEPGREYLRRVRSSPPSRRVNSAIGNVICRFPSQKMGFVLTTESRHGELAVAYQLEHDADTIEFYDQPEAIKLYYLSRAGRPTGAMHTPDFLVLRRHTVSWIEVKAESRLLNLMDTQPHRFKRDADGIWHSPPAEETAKIYGFAYAIVSISEMNRRLIRNLEFLDDYFRDPNSIIPAGLKCKLMELVRTHPGITIASVRQALGSDVMSPLFTMVTSGELFFDLERQLISEQEIGQLFETEAIAIALRIVSSGNLIEKTENRFAGVDENVFLAERESESATRLQVEDFAAKPAAQPAPAIDLECEKSAEPEPVFCDLIKLAAPKDIVVANERHSLLHDPQLAQERGITKQQIRRWRCRFQRAEEAYGNGYVGLIPQSKKKGNRLVRLSTPVCEIASRVIKEVFMTPKRVSKMFTYGRFINECQQACLPPPSYKWFCKTIKQVKAHMIKVAREGKRAAYPLEFSMQPLSAKNLNHGDYPWQVVHIDHTEVDIELVDESTGLVLGRPWLTLMFDAFSRRILCFVLTFDAPATNTLKLLLRECVRRHSRLPSSLVLDWGKEFGSEFFETLTAIYEIRIIKRPPHQARFGSVIEREFGVLNKAFIHNLQGNTQNMVNVRQVTKSINPKRSAVWSLEALHELLTRFCFEIHDHRLHSGIGTTPAQAYEQGLATSGSRPWRRVENDDTFRFLTMASTPKGTARIQPGMGVKIRYFYYWAEDMRSPLWERKEVPVRYDQEDVGVAYARLAGRWVRCISAYYDSLKGKSEKQLRLAVEQLRRKRSLIEGRRTINAQQIARFFESVEGEETLREQRLKDAARHQIVRATAMETKVVSGPPIETSLSAVPAPQIAGQQVTLILPGADPVFEDF